MTIILPLLFRADFNPQRHRHLTSSPFFVRCRLDPNEIFCFDGEGVNRGVGAPVPFGVVRETCAWCSGLINKFRCIHLRLNIVFVRFGRLFSCDRGNIGQHQARQLRNRSSVSCTSLNSTLLGLKRNNWTAST